jgi:hypothetical protein
VSGEKRSIHNPALPEYNHPDRDRFRSLFGGEKLLWLSGLNVEGPIGRKATWKVVVTSWYLRPLLDRFGLDRARAEEILFAISRTPDGKILRYPTEEAAKQAVEEALLKIGLLDPIVEIETMHEEGGYDS